MNKISKRWTIGVLILSIVGAAFLATLYFTPYYRVDYTRFSNVKTDFRKSSEYMLDDNVALIISNKTELEKLENVINQKQNKYDDKYFENKSLIVSVHDGSYYSQSKINKLSIKDSSITVTYGVENDQAVTGPDQVFGIYYIDLIEISNAKIDLTKASNYSINYIDKVM